MNNKSKFLADLTFSEITQLYRTLCQTENQRVPMRNKRVGIHLIQKTPYL